jgi:hypothetical protein
MRFLTTIALLALVGCIHLSRQVPIDPAVNFAAHAEHDQIVLDRVPGGQNGVVKAARRFQLTGSPTFVVITNGQTVAKLALTAPATVQVRRTDGASAPALGGIEPSWEDNAVRLTFRSSGDTTYRSDLFQRTEAGTGPQLLTRTAQTVIDVRGTYRTTLRDAKGGDAGWLRVKVSPYAESPRIYDGVLPTDVGPGLAAATAVALNSEIDWIENHTLDVYRGQSGGPLRESVPLGR